MQNAPTIADTFAVSLTLKICRIWSLPKAGYPNLVITNVIPAFYSEKSRYWYFDNKDAMYTSERLAVFVKCPEISVAIKCNIR